MSVARKLNRLRKQAVRKFNAAKRKALRRSNRGAREAQKGIKRLMKSIKVGYKKHRDKDKTYRARVREIQKLARMKVHVGVLDRGNAMKGSRSGKLAAGLTVREVAAFHEFGLGVPRRSFIRDWYDPNVARIRARAARVSELVIRGERKAKQGGELLGLWAQGEIQQRIADGIGPKLELATIKRKGSNKPLIDTGQLRSSITFKVEL